MFSKITVKWVCRRYVREADSTCQEALGDPKRGGASVEEGDDGSPGSGTACLPKYAFLNIRAFSSCIHFYKCTTCHNLFSPVNAATLSMVSERLLIMLHLQLITAQKSSRFPINIVVGLPKNEGHVFKNPFKLTLAKGQPVFDVAVEDVYNKHQLMPLGSLQVVYEDTQLSDAIAPQRMVEHYCNRSVDAVMGLAYVYALAPVARMSALWLKGVPVFTTSGLVDELGDRKEFPLLTRMMGTYRTLGNLMYEIAVSLNWHHFYFVFNDEAGIEGGKGLPRSECYFSLNAIRNRIQKEFIWHVDMFSTKNATREKYSTLLKKVSMLNNGRSHAAFRGHCFLFCGIF